MIIIKKIITYIIIVFVTCLIIINPEKSVSYARQGLGICGDVIIPSLFPFFVCSGLLIYSGFCEVLSKLFRPVMKPLFNINSSGAAGFVLGIVSGYPLGAVTVCQLYRSMYLSKSEAERLLAFCNNSGPLFILGAVGISIYHSPQIGLVLYIAHILSAVTVGIIFRFYKPDSYSAPQMTLSVDEKKMSVIFSEVLANSVNNILTVCAAVLFCSVISSLVLELLYVNTDFKAILAGMMEFVSGLKSVSHLEITLFNKLLLSAWICAFAGISVHLQVMGVTAKTGLSLKPYIVGKILHGFIAVFYTYVILKFIPVTQTTFINNNTIQKISAAFYMGAVYAIMSVCSFIILAFFYRKKSNVNE